MSSVQFIVSNGAAVLAFLGEGIDDDMEVGGEAALETISNPASWLRVGAHIFSVLPALTTRIGR